jgi:hypothetical protein
VDSSSNSNAPLLPLYAQINKIAYFFDHPALLRSKQHSHSPWLVKSRQLLSRGASFRTPVLGDVLKSMRIVLKRTRSVDCFFNPDSNKIPHSFHPSTFPKQVIFSPPPL